MKIYILFLALFLASCQNSDQQADSGNDPGVNKTNAPVRQEDNFDQYAGTYEYIYPYNTEKSVENRYIVIEKTGNSYSGLFYGTTDEFDYGREGYECGFFVTSMDQIDIDDETIKFTLEIVNDDVFDKPVDLKYKSSEEAMKAGYRNWIQDMEFDPKVYICSIEAGKISYTDETGEIVFKKIK